MSAFLKEEMITFWEILDAKNPKFFKGVILNVHYIFNDFGFYYPKSHEQTFKEFLI